MCCILEKARVFCVLSTNVIFLALLRFAIKKYSTSPLLRLKSTPLRRFEKYYFLGGSTSWANIRGVLTNNISDLKIYEQFFRSYVIN